MIMSQKSPWIQMDKFLINMKIYHQINLKYYRHLVDIKNKLITDHYQNFKGTGTFARVRQVKF